MRAGRNARSSRSEPRGPGEAELEVLRGLRPGRHAGHLLLGLHGSRGRDRPFSGVPLLGERVEVNDDG